MKTSVVIPTYNSARFIAATLESVFRQTAPAEEILVLDDGSTDNTVELLNAYRPRITVLQQKNQGVARARNVLSARAGGELVAFLDHDDLWHPRYLETQARHYAAHPEAVAWFTGHVDFKGYEHYPWPADPAQPPAKAEVIAPLNFLQRYHECPGNFGSMSFCCVSKRVLAEIGPEPFKVSGAEDYHLCSLLPLFGPVVFAPEPLVAYRLLREAQTANRLNCLRWCVTVFELLEDRFTKLSDARMRRAFRLAFAVKRRRYGRLLMGTGDPAQARSQFARAAKHPGNAVSLAKSLVLWLLTCLPSACQPVWPASSREAEFSGRAL